MSEKTAAKLFTPFFTTKRQGTGLGLSTALAIARAHRAYIDLDAREGGGCTFSLLLPASTGPVIANGSLPEVPAPIGRGQTVLIVDDEIGLLEIIKALLDSSNYRVLAAGNAVEALRLYRQHQSEIFAVVTDMLMPVMDGAVLIERLRESNPAVRVICLSGTDPKPENLDPNAWLAKPFTAEQLLSALHEL